MRLVPVTEIGNRLVISSHNLPYDLWLTCSSATGSSVTTVHTTSTSMSRQGGAVTERRTSAIRRRRYGSYKLEKDNPRMTGSFNKIRTRTYSSKENRDYMLSLYERVQENVSQIVTGFFSLSLYKILHGMENIIMMMAYPQTTKI